VRFFEAAGAEVRRLTADLLPLGSASEDSASSRSSEGVSVSSEKVWMGIRGLWDENSREDLEVRARKTAEKAVGVLVAEMSLTTMTTVHGRDDETSLSLGRVNEWRTHLASTLERAYDACREEMFERHNDITPTYLGLASEKMYRFVRRELDVPFHRGLVEDPTVPLGEGVEMGKGHRRTIGSMISVVYEALRDGRLHEPVMEAVREGLMSQAD
ncbi:hypothetical protein LTS18_005884, partial [Coniosporium uncinatum]